MEKIYLLQIKQFDTICYIGKIDPRKLVQMATKVAMGVTQDAQRPLNEKRVKEIAKYINENGVLPSTLIIATTDNRINIKKVESTDNIYEINVPSTDEEFERFENSIDVMDGQHRLYSFLKEIRSISDTQKYEIGFTLFVTPTLETRRKIFVTCNEKQEKVSGNLLMWFRFKLEMFNEQEKELYNLVSKLNESYPLRGHIIMSAERVKNGIKAKELIDVIKKSRIDTLKVNGNDIPQDKKVSMISTYLKSWENVVGFTFASARDSTKTTGAATKIAGLRFMLMLLPSIFQQSLTQQKKFDNEFIENIIRQFISNRGQECNSFFTIDENKVYFASRSSIEKFANESSSIIASMVNESFNPLD